MYLSEPPKAYMHVFEIVIWVNIHAVLCQVFHCFLAFSLQSLNYPAALLVVVQLHPASIAIQQLPGIELRLILSPLAAPGWFVSPVCQEKLQSVGHCRVVRSIIFKFIFAPLLFWLTHFFLHVFLFCQLLWHWCAIVCVVHWYGAILYKHWFVHTVL